MPILTNDLTEKIVEDEQRYFQMINSGELVPDGVFAYYMAIPYKVYLGVDRHIGNSLSTCRLMVLVKGEDVVYSCYYKVAENEYFGRRVVQVEVRQSPDLPGLARSVMRHYWLRNFDAIRTDLSGTNSGQTMWKQFFAHYKKELHFYKGLVNIDLRLSNGSDNQDPACPERVTHLKTMRSINYFDGMWHSNKDGNVSVIYASNKPLRTDQ